MRRLEQDAVQRFGGRLAVITGDGTGTRRWCGSSAKPANENVASKLPVML
jgi:hypothetical protein